ncbi:hypothetical protein JQU17_14595 [Ponticoccus sp. SC2-23]|uniref:hypothetical protein n=1 Tax=Alexandriicola marinus TaxID=2081710 RepID=UPI000FD918E8|nr:hypothetical protein [Alexandriicola marinus]MBM1221900.1 hypothetical protein [Ponticoccus sp. SC6-9]MBM1226251.1 hypothetical protein [Ponticoccus sp. SC6-15]MBM1230847.1 hypothetical protein [Ponticoccus sp. SC6-38]MBM1235312.1 hypothetical protein [Ponticoccus sp. SC6-45]MBM1239869.1 hypothetical protein [Ponticoccus sp. SC6-49]MBM1244013.1 hypothetical protein [Ponticoccus sp. SC2-64]MBM1248836.1 hypothetical protein [Ponticoccus sp. SC6-42]MBM1253524.1 hypothetical protein [Pontico
MTMMINSPAPILSRLAGLFQRTRTDAPVVDHHEDQRNQREVLTEMMSRSPDAFGSDLDVQFMMSQYPGDY